jgi:hypothetical protein
MSIRLSRRLGGSLALLAGLACSAAPASWVQVRGGTVVSLRGPASWKGAECLAPGRKLGEGTLAYREAGGPWKEAGTGQEGAVTLRSTFRVRGPVLTWSLVVRNRSTAPVEVGDLAVPLPVRSDFFAKGGKEGALLKHSFISGDGSFLFWQRPPASGTSLEDWDRQDAFRVYIHARRTVEGLGKDGTWRLPATSLSLAPGEARTYGFRIQWASGYADVRKRLREEGKLDVQVVPGMTLPSDLTARFSLGCKEAIHGVEAEFPAETRIEDLGPGPERTRLFQVRFSRLGENRLTVLHGDGRRSYLEFFSTEPLETLIAKRASFIARHQFRDPGLWYDGLLAEWNLETGVQLGPDNYDRIKGWRIYETTCDDPGLSKPAFLASKLAEFPVQEELDALDRYVERFVWGGLQMTREEPYPYALYGIPDWKRNRDSEDPGPKGRRHLWRTYDYPHIATMYLGLYRVARYSPWMHTALPASEYLRRAHGTAMAMFTVPMELAGWSGYETGYYNEAVIPSLIHELEAAGLRTEADGLRGHWERKVDHFLSGTADLFGSEYPFDSTGFESTHALAAYAMEASSGPAPRFPPARAKAFLERQLAANIFCRGWVEPAYYYLGSDYRGSAGDAFTLSYMSPMGGWGVLDYGLRFAARPAPYLRLGYASMLSSWALMNTGTPESGYGAWFPGKANDGGAGGGFEPAAKGTTWLGQPHRRGSWYYSCETDLGYCGYLRGAATILADDPLFGRTCFGGTLEEKEGGLEVEPRDGVRRRFHARLGGRSLDAVLDRDRFRSLVLRPDLGGLRLQVETSDPGPHGTTLRLTAPSGTYRLEGPGGYSRVLALEAGREKAVEIPVDPGQIGLFTLLRTE